jgi:hypothetical protein
MNTRIVGSHSQQPGNVSQVSFKALDVARAFALGRPSPVVE